jgi:DNA-binding IclR family transcriptional regulator
MRRTRQILPLLVEGSYTAEAIAEKTGYPLDEVRDAIRTLRRSGFVESVIEPAHYKATLLGADVASKPTKTTPAAIARKIHQRKVRQDRQCEQNNTLVGNAIDRQPALAQVWRAA